MEKIKVIFDNNSSIAGGKNPSAFINVFSKNIVELNEFIKRHNIKEHVQVCITDIGLKEGISELETRLISKFNTMRVLNKELLPLLGISAIEDSEVSTLKKKIQAQVGLKIKEYGINVLPLPKVSLTTLAERAVSYTPPFEKDDKGFKDTLIWFSILEDAKVNEGYKYVLVTEDGIFSDLKLNNEFLRETTKEIIVINPPVLEEIIDRELEIGIGLEKVREEVASKIEEDKEFQSLLVKEGLEVFGKESGSHLSTYLQFAAPWRSQVVNLTFKGLTVDVKDKTKDGLFRIEADVSFNALYSGANNGNNRLKRRDNWFDSAPSIESTSTPVFNEQYGASFIPDINPRVLQQRFVISYDQKNQKLKIQEVGDINPSFFTIF